jgi:hypothetical protein
VEAETNSFTGNFPTMYVAGSMTTGYAAANQMKLVAPNQWQASLTLTASTTPVTFKFDTGTGATTWGLPATNGVLTAGGSSISYTAATAGTYVFSFNDSTLVYSVLPPVWFPGVPQNVTATASTSPTTANIVLTWTNSGGTSYSIYKSSTSATSGFTLLTTATDGTAGYTDSAVVDGTTYYYYVTCTNGVFTSSPSAVVGGEPSASPVNSWTNTAMYFNGSWNDWVATGSNPPGSGIAMVHGATGHLWTGNVTMTAAGLAIPTPANTLQIKFDTDNNWGSTSGVAWGSNSATPSLTGTAVLNGSGNIIAPVGVGTYTVTFNESTLAYTITAD